jgi:hypothetical protein
MSGSDVSRDGMSHQRLTDADIDRAISGRSRDDANDELLQFVAALRGLADSGPSVRVAGALQEFIVDGTATSVPAVEAEPETTGPWKIRRLATASVFGIVPAYLVIGSTLAAAALGAAHLSGVVDVPLLPERAPQIQTWSPPTSSDVEELDPSTSSSSVVTTPPPSVTATGRAATTARDVPTLPEPVPARPVPADRSEVCEPGEARPTAATSTLPTAPCPTPPAPTSPTLAPPVATTIPVLAPATAPAPPTATPPAAATAPVTTVGGAVPGLPAQGPEAPTTTASQRLLDARTPGGP